MWSCHYLHIFFSFYLYLLFNNHILSFTLPFQSSSTMYSIFLNRFIIQTVDVWHYVTTKNDTIYTNIVFIETIHYDTIQCNTIHYEAISNNHPNRVLIIVMSILYVQLVVVCVCSYFLLHYLYISFSPSVLRILLFGYQKLWHFSELLTTLTWRA